MRRPAVDEILQDPMSPFQALKAAMKSEMHCAMPGIVTAFDSATQTATIQPAIRSRVAKESGIENIQLPLLDNVPVFFPSGGQYAFTMPVQQGDECLVIFADSCIDAWWQSGEVQNQIDMRSHDISDAFAFVGFRSRPKAISEFNVSAPTLGGETLADNSQLQEIRSQLADIVTANVKAFGAKGDGSTDDYQKIQDAINVLASNDGGILFFPNGVYKISSPLYINFGNVIVKGNGTSSIISSSNIGDTARQVFQVNTAPDQISGANRLKNITIRDLCFDMADVTPSWQEDWTANGYMYGCGALVIQGCDNVLLENILTTGAVHAGITVRGCYNVTVNNCTVDTLRHHVTSQSVIMDGNCFNFIAHKQTEEYTYAGDLGYYRINSCHAVGTHGDFPPPLQYGTTTIANIGFEVQMGGNEPAHQINPVALSNCTAEKCWYGIVVEGQNIGGAGDSIISNNAIRECVYGIFLYPNVQTLNLANSYNLICSNNKLESIYCQGIIARGENVIIDGNLIVDWGIAEASDDFGYNIDRAIGIYCKPCKDENTTGSYKNLVVTNNVLATKHTHNSTYLKPLSGIRVSTPADAIVFSNINISNNILEGNYASLYLGTQDAGIFLTGKLIHVKVHDNLITGWAGCGLAIQANDGSSDWTATPSFIEIYKNTLNNNNNRGVDSPAMIIRSSNTNYNISDNSIYDIGTSYTYTVLEVPKNAGVNVAMDYVTLKNNIARNLKYNPLETFALNITGINVIIENNQPYNYRQVAPASAQHFKGEEVKDVGAVEQGTTGAKYIRLGWRCVAAGTPGTWVETRVLTGN